MARTINDKRNLLASDRFNYDVLNHTDLSRLKGFSGEINLETLNWSNYDLIVIDEPHNFCNNPNRADGEVGGNQTAKQELIKLFEGDPGFLTPKPISMISRVIQLESREDSTIFGFFAVSCSAPEAVLRENASDKGRRRFIAVQLSEPCQEGTAAFSNSR